MSDVQRSTTSVTTTHVRYFAKPRGSSRKNPPSLGDLRAFVAACDGLPDDVDVRIQPGTLGESGRHDVEFSLRYDHPAAEEASS